MRQVTIVMYHFVRKLASSRYPEIKGLDVSDFEGQLRYIMRHYNVVRMEDVISGLADPDYKIPKNALLLTFDDGYADHFQNVFPLLQKFGVQGSFFPPARPILENIVLDVNKIHFLLATLDDLSPVIDSIESLILENGTELGFKSPSEYWSEFAHANRFDDAQTIYVKRMLQSGLPKKLRIRLTEQLFREYVSADEASFAQELYVSANELMEMREHGMYIGSHGYDHCWLNTISRSEQESEIRKSLEFLSSLGCDTADWVMCYPYGGYNDSLIQLLRESGCCVGLTTNVAIADLDESNPMELERIDTNDLPKSPDAPASTWTIAAT